jgi:hypothetical protein
MAANGTFASMGTRTQSSSGTNPLHLCDRFWQFLDTGLARRVNERRDDRDWLGTVDYIFL